MKDKIKKLFKKNIVIIKKKKFLINIIAFIAGIILGIFAYSNLEKVNLEHEKNLHDIKYNNICWNHVGYDYDKKEYIWLNDCKGRASSDFILCKPEVMPLSEAELIGFKEWIENGAKLEALNESCK